MATAGTNLEMKFKDTSGDPWNLTIPYADSSATAAQVKALADGIITNGLMFEKVPTTKVSAAFVTTSVVPVDIIN